MDTQELLQQALEIVKEWTIEVSQPEENRRDIYIEARDIKPAVKALLIDNHWGYLSAITGLDSPDYQIDEETKERKIDPDKGKLEVLYHFCNRAAIATLRVRLPYTDAEIDSICEMLPSASFYEREAMELIGVNFRNTPITDHLILPENWPAGVYPLRKTFKGLEKKTQG